MNAQRQCLKKGRNGINEQIRELFLKSLDANQEFCYQRFAKLIVGECAEICLEANDYKNILRYFGMEEKKNE
jgi:hypothetical protein